MNTLTLGVSSDPNVFHLSFLQKLGKLENHDIYSILFSDDCFIPNFLQLLLSAVVAAVLSSPTHGGGKNGSGDKCRPTTVCSQVRG